MSAQSPNAPIGLLEACEEGAAFLPEHQRGDPHVRTDEWVLNGNAVTRVRLAPQRVAAAIKELRELGRAHSLETILWLCGTLTQPRDLPGRLEEFGVVPWDVAPILTSMALTRPPVGELSADVRRVDSFSDFETAWEINQSVYALEGEELERARSTRPTRWDDALRQGVVYYLGYLDGRPVAWARSINMKQAVKLQGAATLVEARGLGLYTSLVHARWNDAVARGTPTLLVEAVEMSRPILERLGFERLGEMRPMVDQLANTTSR